MRQFAAYFLERSHSGNNSQGRVDGQAMDEHALRDEFVIKGQVMTMGLERFNNGDERRSGSRFAKDPQSEFAVLFLAGDEPHLVEVHDESLAGLGLYLEPNLSIEVGQEVEIIYASSLIRGVVRHIRVIEKSRRLVGFACEPIAQAKRANLPDLSQTPRVPSTVGVETDERPA